MTPERVSIQSRWQVLDGKRSGVLQRARQCAKLTIPYLLPPQGHTEAQTLPTPYQAIGAQGLNKLAAKLLLVLLPPNSPFFRLAIDDFTLEKLTQQEGMRAQVEESLNKIERAVMTFIETSALRVPAFMAFKYLVGLGNALIYMPDEGGMKTYRLDRYCVQRDPMGNIMEIVIKESISPLLLPEGIADAKALENDNPVDLYTRVIRTKRKGKTVWETAQECLGKIVPKSQGWYPEDECPWFALRWTAVDGENYGRGLVEEHLGDLKSDEGLTRAIVVGSAAAAKVVFLCRPGGSTKPKDLSDSESGDFKSGDANDVSVLQMNKYNDFRVALECIGRLEQRLAQAFLLMSSIQRDAERVTAAEFKLLAGELEDALGGVYSVLTQDFQLPLVNRVMAQMRYKRKLPPLPKDTVTPMITTGLEALGRGNDLSKLQTLITTVSQAFGPQVAAERINVSDAITRIGVSQGIDMKGLVKTDEMIAQAQQAAQQQQMMSQIAPGAVQELTKGAMNNPELMQQAMAQMQAQTQQPTQGQ